MTNVPRYMHLNCRREHQDASQSDSQTQCGDTQVVSRQRLSQLIGPLQSTRSAMAVRDHNGELLITDGPFAETKEQMLG